MADRRLSRRPSSDPETDPQPVGARVIRSRSRGTGAATRQRSSIRRPSLVGRALPGRLWAYRDTASSQRSRQSTSCLQAHPVTQVTEGIDEVGHDAGEAPRDVTQALDAQRNRTNPDEASLSDAVANVATDTSDVTLDNPQSMVTLPEGCLFANRHEIPARPFMSLPQCWIHRYWITERPSNCPDCRLAVDMQTDRKVLLVFPSSALAFRNAARLHRSCLRHDAAYVARLLDVVENFAGYPSCLVLERGLYTLADRMAHGPIFLLEGLFLIHSMLKALDFLHSHGIVHGSLEPSSFAFFLSDFTWKLSGLCGASYVEEPSPNSETNACTSPERLDSGAVVSLEPWMDMWSLGHIACDILSQGDLLNTTGVMQGGGPTAETTREGRPEGMHGYDASTSTGDATSRDFFRALGFAASFLTCDPYERTTAAGALRHTLFGCPVPTHPHVFSDDQQNVSSTPSALDGTPEGVSLAVEGDTPGSYALSQASRGQTFQQPPIGFGRPAANQHHRPQQNHHAAQIPILNSDPGEMRQDGAQQEGDQRRPTESNVTSDPQMDPPSNGRLDSERQARGRWEWVPHVLRVFIRRIRRRRVQTAAAAPRPFARPPPDNDRHSDE